MGAWGWTGAWAWLTIGMGPLVVYALVWAWPHHTWSSRIVPSDWFRLLTGIAFAGAVHPALGLLAGLSALWWAVFAMGARRSSDEPATDLYRYGTPRLAGGTLWPLVAMAVWMGTAMPAWAFQGTLWIALSVGVVQVAMGLGQRWESRWVLATRGGMVHGSIGHRTGYGIYLAMLTPLALGLLPWPWNWALVTIYGIGILLSDSMVAALTVTAGMLWMAPGLWTVGVGLLVVGALYRFGPNMLIRWRVPLADRDMRPGHWGRWYTVTGIAKPWVGRIAVWRSTWPRCWVWPQWLIGHGAGAFQLDARRWMSRDGLKEVYAEAHNDYLETLYEYGVLGYAALGLVLWSLWPILTVGSPFVGMLLAASMAMIFNFPMRVAPTATLALLAVIALMRIA